MPDYYFHYTSRENAQSISSSGRIEAGAAGRIYLSLDPYGQGVEAVNRLAIDGKPIEVVGLIPGSLVTPPPPVGFASPLYDPYGRLRRFGGGSEVKVAGPLPSPVTWFTLSAP